jgi:prepilin-type N-terminal cleavage/methylation domain-containing protein
LRDEREGGLVHLRSKSEGGIVHRSSKSEGGFTLVEVLVSTFILTIGMVSTAGLLAVTLQAQQSARESARSTRLAHEKMDELMKLNFTDARVSIGGNLDANVANHNSTPIAGVTVRWVVAAGPMADTRLLTVRVTNMRAQQQRRSDLTTIIRQW